MAIQQRFSLDGLGVGLGGPFDAAIARRPPRLLTEPRGQQLLVACDIGGSQKAQRYETYAFLILDLNRNAPWLAGQARFRSVVLPHRRRMAFKAMNDAFRRRALAPFMELADHLNGVLVTFAVDKLQRPRIGVDESLGGELGTFWKISTIDRLMWVIYLSVFLVSGFSAPGQDVMFIIDEDEVAANVPQLTKLTELFGRAHGNQGGPMMGRLRCGTTKFYDGSLALEDIVAIPDLAAGAIGEFTDVLDRDGAGPLAGILQRLPAGLTWKTRMIMPWLLQEVSALTRMTCIIDGAPGSPKWRATIPHWYTVGDPLSRHGIPSQSF